MDMFHYLVTKNLASSCNNYAHTNIHMPLKLKYEVEDGREQNLIGDVIYEFPVEVESYTVGVDKSNETAKDRYLAFSLFTLSFTSSSKGKYSSSTDIWPLNLHLYSFSSRSTYGSKTKFTLLPHEQRKYMLPTYSFLVPSKYCKLVSDKISRHAEVAIPDDYLSL